MFILVLSSSGWERDSFVIQGWATATGAKSGGDTVLDGNRWHKLPQQQDVAE